MINILSYSGIFQVFFDDKIDGLFFILLCIVPKALLLPTNILYHMPKILHLNPKICKFIDNRGEVWYNFYLEKWVYLILSCECTFLVYNCKLPIQG